MAKKKIIVGAFRGLITKKGKIRLQMRTEKTSMFRGVSYKGDFELPGGRVKKKDLRKILTPQGLDEESAREVEEELGIPVFTPPKFSIYRAVYTYPDGNEDWAITIPTSPDYWDEEVTMKRKTVDVDPDQLNVLGELMLVVSGKKRMWRMSEGGIFALSPNPIWRQRAAELLTEVKPNWRETEYFEDAEKALAQWRKELGLE